MVGQAVQVAGPDHHYLTRVLRLAVGDALLLLDGQGRVAQACITAVQGERCRSSRSASSRRWGRGCRAMAVRHAQGRKA